MYENSDYSLVNKRIHFYYKNITDLMHSSDYQIHSIIYFLFTKKNMKSNVMRSNLVILVAPLIFILSYLQSLKETFFQLSYPKTMLKEFIFYLLQARVLTSSFWKEQIFISSYSTVPIFVLKWAKIPLRRWHKIFFFFWSSGW